MVTLFKVAFLKLLYHSYVQSSFPTITRNIENNIWETLYSWRFYGMDEHTCKSIVDQQTCKKYVQQNSFLGKHRETKIGEGAWKITQNPNLYFEEH